MERYGPGDVGLGSPGRVLRPIHLHNLRSHCLASGYCVFINEPVIVYNVYHTLALNHTTQRDESTDLTDLHHVIILAFVAE